MEENESAVQDRKKMERIIGVIEAMDMDDGVLFLTSRPKVVADMLREYNKWRRGIGRYSWNENPNIDNVEFVMSPYCLGIVLDAAAAISQNAQNECADDS